MIQRLFPNWHKSGRFINHRAWPGYMEWVIEREMRAYIDEIAKNLFSRSRNILAERLDQR